MKSLELNEMEKLQGGDCGTLFGISAGLLIGGFAVAAAGPIGIGVALYFGGAASLWSTGVFCED